MSDLARSIDFYERALGFTRRVPDAGAGRVARLQLGHEWIELVQVDAASMPKPALAPDPRFRHIAIVARDMAAAWQRLMAYRPMPITNGGPQHLPARAGGVQAFKCRDPDGHPLELIAFPAGAGDPRWQQPSTALTLGIDHIAIVVTDAKRSIAFYEALGGRIGARQTNRGSAQGRLDGLKVSVVDVIALEWPAHLTPHLELLCYREPSWQPATPQNTHGPRDVLVVASQPCRTSAESWFDPDDHEAISTPDPHPPEA